MAFPLSPQTIDALAEIISGGVGYSDEEPIGLYRSGPKMEKFMRGCGVDFAVVGSRVPSLTDCLLGINRGDDPAPMLTRIIEAAADPRDFVTESERHARVLSHLNLFLLHDDLELLVQGGKVRLVEAGRSAPVLRDLTTVVRTIDFDTVSREMERALASSAEDPEDSITAACSMLESVCRSILVELEVPLPSKKDLKALYKATQEPLGLSAGRTDLDETVADDVRKVLSGLATVVEGIAALRTHAGDAHGRERGFRRVDKRIADLAIHSASSAALFLIETWQRKFPQRELKAHD